MLIMVTHKLDNTGKAIGYQAADFINALIYLCVIASVVIAITVLEKT